MRNIKIDLNAAPLDKIAKVPGVGAEMAKRIVAGRPYDVIDDLRRVEGVTWDVYEKINQYFRID